MKSRIKRGEIWLVTLDPTVGSEVKKTRPAVIISNDLNNQYANTVTVVPVSDRGAKVYPFEVSLRKKTDLVKKDSKVLCSQVRTVDQSRLVKSFGKIGKNKIAEIEQALLIHLGIEV